MTVEKVKSADGTSIAFEAIGEGPAIVIVGGAFCDRHARSCGTPLAKLLAPKLRAVSYDRRDRGDSQNKAVSYAIEREIEDLGAVLEKTGASFVHGMSSGALLALEGAAANLPIKKLSVYEPPLRLGDDAEKQKLELARAMEEAVKENRRADAVELFLVKGTEMPKPAFDQLRKSPFFSSMEALAHTLPFDMIITSRSRSLLERAKHVSVDTRVMIGGASSQWFHESLQALTKAMPNATLETLPGQTHDVDPKLLAESLLKYFAG